jgi:hypothetical protein
MRYVITVWQRRSYQHVFFTSLGHSIIVISNIHSVKPVIDILWFPLGMNLHEQAICGSDVLCHSRLGPRKQDSLREGEEGGSVKAGESSQSENSFLATIYRSLLLRHPSL